MKLKKIVADIDIPYLSGVLEPFADVVYIKGTDISTNDLTDADVLVVRTRTICDRELLKNSSVRLIITATIGFDHIDIDFCNSAGIEVITSAGCNARAVLQWVAGVLACASKAEGWTPEQRTIGIVGVGHVGSLIAEYARMWGFRVLCCDPPRARANNDTECDNFVSIDTIIADSDIITFHVPLYRNGHDATYHLADSKFFDQIKHGTLIINSSRGEVVDTYALKQCVVARVCSCAIDTWENEPDIDRELVSLALVATTHIAGYSAQGKANGTAIVVNSIALRHGLPIVDWYPSPIVARSSSRSISWAEMVGKISCYCDLESESLRFKSDPSQFEPIRNNYCYRNEFF